jgi:recombination protein RecR
VTEGKRWRFPFALGAAVSLRTGLDISGFWSVADVRTASTAGALIEALRRLPGVGVKSAQRMAFHLLQRDQAGARQLARALVTAVDSVRHCERCHTFTQAVCSICRDAGRDAARLCVVETPADLAAMERTGAYRATTMC